MLAWSSLTFCLFCRPCIRLDGCSMAGDLLHSAVPNVPGFGLRGRGAAARAGAAQGD